MQSITKIIQDENLLNLSIDPTNMMNILREILVLFKGNITRIDELSEAIQRKANTEDFDRLSGDFVNLNKEVVNEFTDVRHKFEKLRDETNSSVKDLRDYCEDSSLTTLGEARRLISVEISQLMNAQHNNDISKIKDNLSVIDIKLENLNERISGEDNGANTNDDYNKPGSSYSSKINELKQRISDMETKLQTYDLLQDDVNSVMTQFPLLSRKLESKVDNYISTARSTEKHFDDLGDIPPMPNSNLTSTANVNNNNNISNNNNSSNNKSDENGIKITSSLNKPENNVTSFQKFNADEPEFKPTFPEIEMPKVEVFEDLKAMSIQKVVPDYQKSSVKSFNEISNNISLNSKLTSLDPNDGKRFESNPSLNSTDELKPVTVLENRYVTEMNSSVRMVSELEWVKSLIQKHHDAIRQLQQGMHTQQEIIDNMKENIARVNATHQSRIAQLAQQENRMAQEAMESKRHITDQITRLQNQMLNAVRPTYVEIPVDKTPTNSQRLPSRKLSAENGSSNINEHQSKIIPKLPALDNMLDDKQALNNNQTGKNNKEEEDLNDELQDNFVSLSSSENDINNKNENENQSTTNDKNEANDLSISMPPTLPKKKYNFSLTTSHFSTNVNHSLFMMSEIRTLSNNTANKSGITHMELFNSMGIGAKTARSIDSKKDDVDDSKDVKPQDLIGKEALPQRPIIMAPEMMHFGKLPRMEMKEITLDDIPLDMIEEKVARYARKAVAILADSAKEDIKETALDMKKNVDYVVSLIDGKIDREFVERMFNKFRVMLNEINEKVENIQFSFLEWVTRDELEMVLQNFVKVVADVKDSAATKSKYNCLLCGKPREHLAGMMLKHQPHQYTDQANGNDPSGGKKEAMRMSSNAPIIKPLIPRNSLLNEMTSTAQSVNSKPRNVVQLITSLPE